jgi:phosphoglycerate kinase
VGDAARKVVQDLRPGQICLLENLGAFPEEEQNEESFAHKLARFADVYVNDALSDCEHAYASLDALPRLIRERGMSLALAAELRAIAGIVDRTAPPFVLALGGGSVADRLDLLESLLERCNVVLVAGALGNTLLAARGADMKDSRIDGAVLARGRALLTRARDRGVELVLPLDLLVAESTAGANSQVVAATSVPAGNMALDIGPKTLELYGDRVRKARTALWWGAFGAPRSPTFAGNISEFSAKFAPPDAEHVRVVVGDDTRAAVSSLSPELKSTIGFVSAGGRASIELIKRRRLPGIEALRSGAS